MRARILAMLVITSILTACGTTASRDQVRAAGAESKVTPAGASHADRPDHRPDRYRTAHYHREPSPKEQYMAEIAFLLTAQIFVCSFVVVILDGSCEFYASTGYYY